MSYGPSRASLIRQPRQPKSETDFRQLCGWAGEAASDAYWSEHAGDHAQFAIAGASEPKQKVQLWRIWRDVLGFEPDTTPQPTGNCVAAAADDVVELVQAIEIAQGDRERFRPIYNPYHYATGRVLIGKNRLKGGAGSLGGWQADAIRQYGVIPLDQDGLPKYTTRNVDAWGDDKPAEGKGFRDYIEQGKEHPIKTTAPVKSLDDVIQSLDNLYPITIAANFGYEMKARDPKGFMRKSGRWSHQMSVWSYCLKREYVEIKNQWGPKAHGQLIDPDDDEKLPLGFLRVTFKDFEDHLRRAETISFSNFDGFPEQHYDFGRWA